MVWLLMRITSKFENSPFRFESNLKSKLNSCLNLSIGKPNRLRIASSIKFCFKSNLFQPNPVVNHHETVATDKGSLLKVSKSNDRIKSRPNVFTPRPSLEATVSEKQKAEGTFSVKAVTCWTVINISLVYTGRNGNNNKNERVSRL